MIEVRDLSYEYPGRRALDGVSFSIAAGSITALVGPNGAGKTTLLRCLAGMERPLSGTIDVDGVDVVEEPRRSHLHLGYLSDFFGLYERLTVRQCLSYVGAANGLTQETLAQTVVATATELGLGERLEQCTGELSRGLRQRVASAQAIIHGPTVVLLDEPASGLDPEARFSLGELFVTLAQRGMTLLVSSHILAELEAYSSHMLILRDGKLVEHRQLAGSIENVSLIEASALEGPATLATALRHMAGVNDVTVVAQAARFALAGTAVEQAALLQALLAAGLRISHFAVVTEDLQQSYIQAMGAERSTS
jgi:ABC-2 type transport system ATP-binding protein